MMADFLQDTFTEPDDEDFDRTHKQQVDSSMENLFRSNPRDIKLVTQEELIWLITNKIRTKGAPGSDGITNKAIKNLPPIYMQLLQSICNASLRYSFIPKSWKHAIVTMIPKPEKDHLICPSHRPISLLITLSKLMERVILTRLGEWLEEIGLISILQCGFRGKRQTTDHILRLIQDAITGFNVNQKCGALFIDIEKAFDKVWHNGLLHVLDSHKIPDYLGRWILNYLTGRTFQVRTGKILSTIRLIFAGVPQGSVLGPILFIIYFNSLTRALTIPRGPSQGYFADDVAIWKRSTNIKAVETALQESLNHIMRWMDTWRMKISSQKTVYCIFNKGSSKLEVNLEYKGRKIQADHNPRFLGVYLDPGLHLHIHAETMATRALKRINMLRSIKGHNWGASEELIINSFKVLIRPIMEYAPIATLIMSDKSKNKIEKVQRAAVRVATYWPIKTSTATMYAKFNLKSAVERAQELADNYMVKSIANNELIQSTAHRYTVAAELADGAHSKNPRPTPLGVLRMNKRTKSSQQLTSSDPVETRQVAPMHPTMEPDNNAALDT